MSIRSKLKKLVVDLDERWDRSSHALRQRLGRVGEPTIVNYRGFGNAERLLLHGRVQVLRTAPAFSNDDDFWDNLVNMYRRLHTSEIPGARIRASAAGVSAQTRSDSEGFFQLELKAQDRCFSQPRQLAELELLGDDDTAQLTSTAEVVTRSPASRLLVISDIDDTLVHTNATDLLAMARATFLGNAGSRTPFRGAAALYSALVNGATGDEANPLVFISRSPWNLYDLFDQFCDLQGLPAGRVFFLRDWGISNQGLSRASSRGHKYALIRRVLEIEPDLPVLLLGDSGQKDPEIYSAIVEDFPDRIRGIFVRDVTTSAERTASIEKLAAEAQARGAALYLADDSLAIALCAVRNGWIAPDAVRDVTDAMQDNPPPEALTSLLRRKPERN